MKITESQLREMISETIKKCLKEKINWNSVTPEDKKRQEEVLWNKYGNRSIVPIAGCEHQDDYYTRLRMDSGELAMQAQCNDEDWGNTGSLWRKNGQSPKWRSPKGNI